MALIFGRTSAGQPVDIRMNCGVPSDAPTHTDIFGRDWPPEQSYSESEPPKYGFVGGQSQCCFATFEFGGTNDPELFFEARESFDEYRFDVPNGLYIVQLRFVDTCVHGAGLRVFDIVVEGSVFRSNFDIVAEVGKDYAVDYTFPALVQDGQLNFSANPIVGDALLSAISVVSAVPDGAGPDAPAGPSAIGGFRENILTWLPGGAIDWAGYNIYRADDANGPFELIHPHWVVTRRYLDRDVSVGQTHYYQVRAFDVWGNEGPPTETVSAAPVDDDATPLPIYEIDVSQEGLATLNADPFSDDEVNADFSHAGDTYPNVAVRYRGSASRNFSKKNWKIKLDENDFNGRSRVNVQAEFIDESILRDWLAFTLFKQVGVPTSDVRYVHLNVNGDYWGLYLDIDQVNERFLELNGLDEQGSLYKADYATLDIVPSYAIWAYYEKEDGGSLGFSDLIYFIETINHSSEDAFPAAMHQVLDVSEYLDYYAMIILTGNIDFAANNHYWYHDPDRDLWMIFPWDLHAAFGADDVLDGGLSWDTPINLGVEGVGPGANRLITRLMEVDAFRDYFADRIEQWINEPVFNTAALNPLIDEKFDLIKFNARRDIRKFGWEHNDLFNAGADIIKFDFIPNRIQFLLGEIPDYAPDAGPYLHINEVMPDNVAGITDESGEHEPWIELYNEGVADVDIGGMYLTNDLDAPTLWQFPDGTSIDGGGHLIVWTDNEASEGDLHAAFQLDSTGGTIGLFALDGVTQLDLVNYGPLPSDIAEGRTPDGSDTWLQSQGGSPGSWNHRLQERPVITDIVQSPTSPSSGQPVSVTCTVSGQGPMESVTIHATLAQSLFAVDMFDDGAHGDGPAGDGVWGAEFPPFGEGVHIAYFIEAFDEQGYSQRAPINAPNGEFTYVVGGELPIFINEFMADNDNVVQDDTGDYDDWLELYNAGDAPIHLGGMFLTDDLGEPTKWQIPDGVMIDAHGYLVFWADNDTEDGGLHMNFALSAGGEEIGLFDPTGQFAIDAYSYDEQETDIAEGRSSDAGPIWIFFETPTPGASNNRPGDIDGDGDVDLNDYDAYFDCFSGSGGPVQPQCEMADIDGDDDVDLIDFGGFQDLIDD